MPTTLGIAGHEVHAEVPAGQVRYTKCAVAPQVTNISHALCGAPAIEDAVEGAEALCCHAMDLVVLQ